MQTDPFAPAEDDSDNPFEQAPDVSNYPSVKQLKGHLLLIRPTKFEPNLLSSFSKPGKPMYQDRITADVVVLDGPVEDFEETEFSDMYLSQSRVVAQLKKAVQKQGMILGRMDTRDPGEDAGEGNPWGLVKYTEADAIVARQYLEKK